ncbi:hypothetical protein [Microlunatus sp. GCM10028923]|uniref:hypothetical protein n=1 Tax=Microlunatus sp. GCM10028923 TaxID=3273400 RepID=UPI00361EE6B4
MNPETVLSVFTSIFSGMAGLGLALGGYRILCWVYDHGRPTSPAPDDLARRAYGYGIRIGEWTERHPGLAIATAVVGVMGPPIAVVIMIGEFWRMIARLIGGLIA